MYSFLKQSLKFKLIHTPIFYQSVYNISLFFFQRSRIRSASFILDLIYIIAPIQQRILY